MSELIASLASVTGLILGLLLGVGWLLAAPASRGPRRWLAALLIVYLVATVHGLSRIASWPLRRGFHPIALSDAPRSARDRRPRRRRENRARPDAEDWPPHARRRRPCARGRARLS